MTKVMKRKWRKVRGRKIDLMVRVDEKNSSCRRVRKKERNIVTDQGKWRER